MLRLLDDRKRELWGEKFAASCASGVSIRRGGAGGVCSRDGEVVGNRWEQVRRDITETSTLNPVIVCLTMRQQRTRAMSNSFLLSCQQLLSATRMIRLEIDNRFRPLKGLNTPEPLSATSVELATATNHRKW